jgi:thioredoxin 1
MKRIQLRSAKKPYTDLHSAPAVEALMAPGGGAAVIDFWAPWCAPCKALAPHFERVAEAYAEQPVKFYKINTEAQPALAQAFHVASIPTMLFVLDGEILDVSVGALDASRLAAKVDWLLSKARGEGLLSRWFGWGKKQQA